MNEARDRRRAPRSPPGSSLRRDGTPSDGAASPHARFLRLDRARALREWQRYEGTPQRELFRQLRERFLARHARPGGWAVDVGAGPGRFSGLVGGPGTRRIALDLSSSMLAIGRELAARSPNGPRRLERVRGDALRPPLGTARFAEVAVLGNTLGFEAVRGPELLRTTEELLAPRGSLLVEIAPGPGERSRYLARLPPGAVRRLLAAPLAALAPRVEREGFAVEPVRHRTAGFRRWTAGELGDRWTSRGWRVRETLAVAPALGADVARVAAAAEDPSAWQRLLELEEMLGRQPVRWTNAAAVLVAAERTPSAQTI